MAVKSGNGRWPIFIGISVTLLFLAGITFHSSDDISASMARYWPASGHHQPYDIQSQGVKLAPAKIDQDSFFDIALRLGDEKVAEHSYHEMYERYLPALRHKRIKMLEIGLECDMASGPAPSYYTWLEYFPYVDLYFLVNHRACVELWAEKMSGATIIIGDPADGDSLDTLVQDYGNDFDIIVDGGEHTIQQQVSFEHLWKALKPGGLYFCENLQTSYWTEYDAEDGTITMMEYVYLLMEDLTWGPRRVRYDQAAEMGHIDCGSEICGFVKKNERE